MEIYLPLVLNCKPPQIPWHLTIKTNILTTSCLQMIFNILVYVCMYVLEFFLYYDCSPVKVKIMHHINHNKIV